MNAYTRSKAAGKFVSVLVLLSLAFAHFGLRPAQGASPAYGDSGTTIPQTGLEPPAQPLPPDEPERGLIYEGLEVAGEGPCKGLYQTVKTHFCTHGPDPAPHGVDLKQIVPPLEAIAEPAIPLAQCEGDGTSGKRVQVIYARASDVPDRYSTYLASFQQWVNGMDAIFQDIDRYADGTTTTDDQTVLVMKVT